MTATIVTAIAFARAAPPPAAENLGSLLVWVAVPACILGAFVAAAIKWAVLARPRFREHRPGLRTFIWISIADLIAWAVLWPSLLAVRLQGLTSNRGLWVFALFLVVALGYLANRYGFAKALHPSVAGSVRGTLLAELFTVLMPVLAVVFGLMIFGVLGWLGV